MNRLSKYLPWVLMLAAASLFFLPLGSRALWNSDEGRYAEIAREMLELRDWVTPHLNYVLYFEKPPLVYWLTAASFSVFGQTEFAARFCCAFFGLLTVGVVFLFGNHWKSERMGLLAGGILATSVGFFLLTQFLVLDMVLTFWMTLALYASSRMLQERPPDRVRRFTDLLAVAIAGGLLTKGLVALVLPVAILLVVLAYTRLGVQARKMSWQSGFILMAVIAAPWFILISLKHPEFPRFFFVHEHFQRFLTTVHHRTAPFYFFVPVLFFGFLPWSVFLPILFKSAFEHRGAAMKRDPVLALLVVWSAAIFAFFSLSQSKLVGYVLPVLPALALLVASVFEDAIENPEFPAWIERGVVALILFFVALLVALKVPFEGAWVTDPIVSTVRTHSGALGLMLGIGVFVLVGVWGMRETVACLAGITLVFVLLLSTIQSLVPALDPYFSNKGLSRILSLRARPEERVVAYGISYEDVLQSVPFYTGRRVVVEGKPGELEFGRDHAIDAAEWFLTDPGAPLAFRGMAPRTWVITSDEAAVFLRQSGSLDPFDVAGREGPLLLLHKVR